ncbi:MAG: TIGR03560 family F420-dependent LLM class oxidoreductase [Candidatus Binatia bacterium]|nr:TIGR03560 family F420-dependent LLM class oxidoreductase [Candidatus Binatia bacterium]
MLEGSLRGTRVALLVIGTLAVLSCADRKPAPPAVPKPEPSVRFGLMTPTDGARYEDILRAWREAERLGWHSLWLNDHFMPVFGDTDRNQYEAWTLLAALAAQTERVRIGVLVTGNTYRNPALLAKMAATVDEISRGRLDLGIGAGWYRQEHFAYGFHFGSDRERAERLEEALKVLNLLWGEEHPTFRGKYYALYRAPFAPRGVQSPRVPIIVGGQGKKWIVPLVARYADGWNAPVQTDAQGFAERVELIRQECQRIGRHNCPTRFSKMFALVTISNMPLVGPAIRTGARMLPQVDAGTARHLLAGSPADIAEQILPFVRAGCNEVIVSFLPPFESETIRQFTAEVIPRVLAAQGNS